FTEGLEYEEIKEYQERGKETVSIFEYFNKNKFSIPQKDAFTENIFIIEDLRVLRLKEKIEKVGRPLKKWGVRIYFGIKTGFNEAFIIDTETRNKILANCKTEDERRRTEEIIKPILRGRDIEKWRYKWAGLYLILIPAGWTNRNRGGEDPEQFFKNSFPALYNHFMHFKTHKGKGKGLFDRDDQGDYWWELRPCDYYPEFEKEKIVWQRVTQSPKFAIVPPGFYCEATTHFIICSDKTRKFLLGVLNSSFFKFAFYKFYMGGGIEGEIKGEFIGRFPIPKVPEDQQKPIVDLVDKILSLTQSPDYETNKQKREEVKAIEKQIDEIVYKLYGLTEEEVKLIEGGLS
ncbi:MAG: TaqI-like C-terminal specificity domain-containing protein, partial [candidate division WOR-3 bacterium]